MSLSLGQRANRIVNRQGPETRAPRAQRAEAQRQLSDDQLTARWRSLTIKLHLVIRVFTIKNMVKTLLGPQNYLRMCGNARRQAENPEAPIVTRVIGGEIVGKPKEPGDGVVQIDPRLCQHPEQKMKPRGNRSDKWWTCESCQSRWERRSLESLIQTGPVTGGEIMLTGRHLG